MGAVAIDTAARHFGFVLLDRRMADNLDGVLQALRARFIDQNLLTPQQAVENQMARQLLHVLRDARILPAYERDVKIGPEEFQVSFTLAHMAGEHRADRALRPLNFDLTTSTDIFNHGDEWIQKLRRLKRLGFRPDRCLIAARDPKDEDPLKQDAFRQIRDELLGESIELVAEGESDKVVQFARLPEAPILKLAQ